jgi:hypothetical protein
MGNPFSSPVYSDGIDRAPRDPQQLRQGWGYLEALRRNVPGQWSDNRWEQVNHFKDVIYVAGRRIMSLFFGSTYAACARKRPSPRQDHLRPRRFGREGGRRVLARGPGPGLPAIDDPEHPLARLLSRPNPHESMGRVTAKGNPAVPAHRRLPAWCVPNAKSRPVELYPLRTPFLYPQPPSHQYPNGSWRVTANGAGVDDEPPVRGGGGAVLPGEEGAAAPEPAPHHRLRRVQSAHGRGRATRRPAGDRRRAARARWTTA